MNVTVMSRRRLAAVAAATALLLGVSACGGEQEKFMVEGVGLVKEDQLTVCTHLPYKPFQFKNDSGEVVGFDVELLDLLAEDLGVEQEVVHTDWNRITSGAVFAAGQCDIGMGAMTITPEREKAIGISQPYMAATQVMLVKADSPYKSLADLEGKQVGVQVDTTGQAYAEEHEEEFGYTVVPFDDLALETNNVKSGRVEAAINDNGVLYDFVKDNPDTKVVAEFDTGEHYGFAAQKDDKNASKLLDKLNAVLDKAEQDGTYDQIYKKWFGVEPKS